MTNETKFNRKSIRLKDYDYSNDGLYFITLCCKDKKAHFGFIDNEILYINERGRIIEKLYLELPDKYRHIECLDYVIMPNHFHCIVHINKEMINKEDPITRHPKLGEIIAYFKYQTTKIINLENHKLWQRNYWEHIIRNNRSYCMISEYISENPTRWINDKFHIENQNE